MNLYHYTIGSKLATIAQCGDIRPTAIMLGPRERSLLWFSRHPHFEPTALKMIMRSTDEGLMLATFDQLVSFVGVYRFLIDEGDVRLHNWSKLPRLAHIDPADVYKMIRVGIERGATPSDWFGSFVPIPLYDLGFQEWTGDAWRCTTIQSACDTTPANRHRILSVVATS